MTENKRRFYHIIADGSALVIMQIRSTDSYIIQLYQNFIILWRRNVTLRKSHLADTVHHCYFHLTFHVKCPPYIRFSQLNKIVLLSFSKIPLFYRNVNYKSNIFYVQMHFGVTVHW